MGSQNANSSFDAAQSSLPSIQELLNVVPNLPAIRAHTSGRQPQLAPKSPHLPFESIFPSPMQLPHYNTSMNPQRGYNNGGPTVRAPFLAEQTKVEIPLATQPARLRTCPECSYTASDFPTLERHVLERHVLAPTPLPMLLSQKYSQPSPQPIEAQALMELEASVPFLDPIYRTAPPSQQKRQKPAALPVRLPKKEAKRASRKKRVGEDRQCLRCGNRQTPYWRRGPDGPATLCNACGLQWAKKKRKEALQPSSGAHSGRSPEKSPADKEKSFEEEVEDLEQLERDNPASSQKEDMISSDRLASNELNSPKDEH